MPLSAPDPFTYSPMRKTGHRETGVRDPDAASFFAHDGSSCFQGGALRLCFDVLFSLLDAFQQNQLMNIAHIAGLASERLPSQHRSLPTELFRNILDSDISLVGRLRRITPSRVGKLRILVIKVRGITPEMTGFAGTGIYRPFSLYDSAADFEQASAPMRCGQPTCLQAAIPSSDPFVLIS